MPKGMYTLLTLMPQAEKIPAAKAASESRDCGTSCWNTVTFLSPFAQAYFAAAVARFADAAEERPYRAATSPRAARLRRRAPVWSGTKKGLSARLLPIGAPRIRRQIVLPYSYGNDGMNCWLRWDRRRLLRRCRLRRGFRRFALFGLGVLFLHGARHE